jgi:hypothetical protein
VVTSQLAGTTRRKRKIDLRRKQLTGTNGRKSGPSNARTTSTISDKSSNSIRAANNSTRVVGSSSSTTKVMEAIAVTNLRISSTSSNRNIWVDSSRVMGTGGHRCSLGTSSSNSLGLITTRVVTTTTISNSSIISETGSEVTATLLD